MVSKLQQLSKIALFVIMPPYAPLERGPVYQDTVHFAILSLTYGHSTSFAHSVPEIASHQHFFVAC